MGAAVTLVLLGELAGLPFAARGRVVRVRFGLVTQGWAGWAVDRARGLLISLPLTLGVLFAVYGLAGVTRWWWVWAALGAAALTVLLSFLAPLVFEPLFNRFTPMEPGPLREALLALAARDGVTVRDVLVADASRRTTALNAYVSGIGSTRRIVVYDTLISTASAGEVELVVAHELGHVVHRDVARGTALGAVGAAAGVCVLAAVVSLRPLLDAAGVTHFADPRSAWLLAARRGGRRGARRAARGRPQPARGAPRRPARPRSHRFPGGVHRDAAPADRRQRRRSGAAALAPRPPRHPPDSCGAHRRGPHRTPPARHPSPWTLDPRRKRLPPFRRARTAPRVPAGGPARPAAWLVAQFLPASLGGTPGARVHVTALRGRARLLRAAGNCAGNPPPGRWREACRRGRHEPRVAGAGAVPARQAHSRAGGRELPRRGRTRPVGVGAPLRAGEGAPGAMAPSREGTG